MGCELSKMFTRQNRVAPLYSPLHKPTVSKSKTIGVDNSDVSSNLHKCGDGQEDRTIMLSGDSDEESLFSSASMEIPDFDDDNGGSGTPYLSFKNPDIKSDRSYHTPSSFHTPNLVTASEPPILNYLDSLKRKNDGTSISQLCYTSSVAETLASSDDCLTPLPDQERRVAKRNRPYASKRRRVISPWIQTVISEILAPEAFEKGNGIVPGIDSEVTDIHKICKRPKAAKGPRRPMQPMIMPTGHNYLKQRVPRVAQQGMKQ